MVNVVLTQGIRLRLGNARRFDWIDRHRSHRTRAQQASDNRYLIHLQ